MQDFRYDPGSLRDHAARLVAQSDEVTRNFVVMGATTGLFVALTATNGNFMAGGVVAVLGAASGFVISLDRKRAMLRDAEVALCLIQIEENTRAGKYAAAPPVVTPKDRLQKTLPGFEVAPEPARPAPVAPPPAPVFEPPATIVRPEPVKAAPPPPADDRPSYLADSAEASGKQPAWLANAPKAATLLDDDRPSYAAEWPSEDPPTQVDEDTVADEPAYAADAGYEPEYAGEPEPAYVPPPAPVAEPAPKSGRAAKASKAEPKAAPKAEPEPKPDRNVPHVAGGTSFAPSFGNSMWVPDDEDDVEAV